MKLDSHVSLAATVKLGRSLLKSVRPVAGGRFITLGALQSVHSVLREIGAARGLLFIRLVLNGDTAPPELQLLIQIAQQEAIVITVPLNWCLALLDIIVRGIMQMQQSLHLCFVQKQPTVQLALLGRGPVRMGPTI